MIQRILPYLPSITTQTQIKRPAMTPSERYKHFNHENLKKDEEKYIEKKKAASQKAYANAKTNDTEEEKQRKR